MSDTHPSICWIHGWAGHARVWARLTAEMPEYQHRFPSFSSVTAHQDFLPTIQAAIPPPPVVLVGWSMGGMLAIEAAAADGQVAGVVVIGGTSRFVSKDKSLGWAPVVIRRMQKTLKHDPDATLRKFLKSMFSPAEIRDDLVEPYINNILGANLLDESDFTVEGLAAGLDYLLAADVADALERLTMPVMWIHGSDDRISPVGAFEMCRGALGERSNYTFDLVPGGGHALIWSRHRYICSRIREFAAVVDG